MIARSWRAPPGSGTAARPICTWRLVLVTVPSFSGQAEAGSTTSASAAVSVRNRSCTTRWSSRASAARAWFDVRVGHGRVLAHDVHAAELAALGGAHDLHHREAGLRVEGRAPELFEMGAPPVVVRALVVREHHRDQPGVGGALHVVLAAQGVQAGAGAPGLAAQQGQRDQAARVVRAVGGLRDAHAPEDHRRAGAGEHARHAADLLGGDAAERRHLLRRVGRDVVADQLEILGVGGDVLPVVQPLPHHHVAAWR